MNRRITLLAAGLAMLAGGGLELAAQPAQPAKPAADSKAEDGASEADDSLYDCKKARGRFKVTLRPDTELKDLIGWAMTFSCRNFVYNPAIGGRAAKVTVMSPQSVTAGQAWRVFLTALQSMNLTIVPKGTVLEIVEQPQAKTQALPIYLRGRPPASDQVVRAVIRPQHLGVNDLAQILQSLKSKDGEVKPQEKIGVIVVTDFGSHIAKMGALVTAVDSPVSGERLYMIKVKHADATELATKLSEILGTAEGGGASAPPAPAPRGRRARAQAAAKAQADANIPDSPDEAYRALPSKIIADDRLNALILLSSRAAYLRVKALVDRLDIALDFDSGGKIHVYTLEHADAEEMAQTLTSVISGIQQPSGGANNQPGRPRRPAPAPAAAGTASDAAAFEGQVRVTHDKPTNSLVAVASAADFIALRRIIRQLDTPRRQVYLEATIVEVSVDNSLDLGVSFHGGVEQDGSIILGGVQHNELSSLNVATLASATGLIGGILGPLLDNAEEFLGTSIPSFGVLFQALATSGNVHVLSSPHILTTDNEEAEISVGQNIPYQSAIGFGGIGTPGQGGGGLFPTQSVQRQDVALTLKITPQINASDVIRLQIDLEISDIASENFGGLGPSWAKRTIKDVVVVRDQQAVVIGGLMNDRTSTSESKVPLLGDIPVLGYLFKYKSTSKEKRNLLVMLTPYVVKDQLDIERIVERRVREQREFMRTFSTFRSMKYRPDVDYRRKRGLLEEINRAALQVERETLELEELERRQILFPDGPIEEFPADEGEETEGEDEAETPGPAEGDTGGSRP